MAPTRPTPSTLPSVLVFCLLASTAIAAPELFKPEKRSLSLFTIVNFPNEQCVTASDTTMRGTCFASSECSDKGGTADGNCASGFGVCCMFTIAECGGTVEQNCTYVTNPGYPSSYSISASTTCTYRVSYVSTDICQLRLDFDNFVIADPGAASGACATDTFVATGPTGRNPPTICGTNTNQHMYVETGTSSTQTTLVFTMDGTTSATRTYKVKISQIPCMVNYKAPRDCTQYFTGTTGVASSYNFGHMLQDQFFSTCVRTEQGNCAINWSQASITSPDPFALDSLHAIVAGSMAPTTCAISYIVIPVDSISPPIFCGGSLNNGGNAIAANAATSAGVLTSEMTPFKIETFAMAANMAATLTGYSVMYSQVPC